MLNFLYNIKTVHEVLVNDITQMICQFLLGNKFKTLYTNYPIKIYHFSCKINCRYIPLCDTPDKFIFMCSMSVGLSKRKQN